MSSQVYIIAGPNGAGKTTFAAEFLSSYSTCKNFASADLIAQNMAPVSPETATFHAGRLMLQEIDRWIGHGEDFGFESTLSGRTSLRMIQRLKAVGYRIHIIVLMLPTVELALARIRCRVLQGGPNVSESIVRRRFGRSIRNFFTQYRPLADSWMVFDNSGLKPDLIRLVKSTGAHVLKRRATPTAF